MTVVVVKLATNIQIKKRPTPNLAAKTKIKIVPLFILTLIVKPFSGWSFPNHPERVVRNAAFLEGHS
jgi:hypothetical protein